MIQRFPVGAIIRRVFVASTATGGVSTLEQGHAPRIGAASLLRGGGTDFATSRCAIRDVDLPGIVPVEVER